MEPKRQLLPKLQGLHDMLGTAKQRIGKKKKSLAMHLIQRRTEGSTTAETGESCGWLTIESKYLKRRQLRYVRVHGGELKCLHVGRKAKTGHVVNVEGMKNKAMAGYDLFITTSNHRRYAMRVKHEPYYEKWLNIFTNAKQEADRMAKQQPSS